MAENKLVQQLKKRQNQQLQKTFLQLGLQKSMHEGNIEMQDALLEMLSTELTNDLKVLDSEVKGINSLVTQRAKILTEQKEAYTALQNAEKQLVKYYQFEAEKITKGPNAGEWQVKRTTFPLFDSSGTEQRPGTETYDELLGDDKAKENYDKQRKFWQTRISTLTTNLSAKAEKQGSFENRLNIINTEIGNALEKKNVKSKKAMEIYDDLQMEQEVMRTLTNMNSGKTGAATILKPLTKKAIPGVGNQPGGSPVDTQSNQPFQEATSTDPTKPIKREGGAIRMKQGMGQSTSFLNEGDMQRNMQNQISPRLNNAERNFVQNPGGRNLKMIDDKDLVGTILKNFLT